MTASGAAPPRTGRHATWTVVAWLGFWVLAAGLVVLPHMSAFSMLSPFDEQVHVDYLDKAGRWELVTAGEKVDETAMREQACRGHENPEIRLPPCDSRQLRPEQFPNAGYNTAYGDPPTYYYATAWVAAVIELFLGDEDVVTTGRAVGVLWLGGGLAVTFLLALRLGASRLAATGAGLLVASNPAIAHASATITSDAPALLLGGVLCLTAWEVVQDRLAWWWLAAAAAAATAVKVTSLTVVGAVVVFLVLSRMIDIPTPGSSGERPERGPAGQRRWVPVLATIGGAAVPVAAWAAFMAATSSPEADESPMARAFHVSTIGWAEVSGNLFALVTPLRSEYVLAFMRSPTTDALLGAVQIVLLCALAAMSWYGVWRAPATRMAFATLTSMVVSGPAFVILVFVATHSYVEIPSRYGLSLVAPAAACLAVAASRRRPGALALLALGVLSLGSLLYRTL